MPERDRRLLLLRHEGYSYHELATALGLVESSVGTLLRRARAVLRVAIEGTHHASD
jgi:DNA-directed RNA polymerase specialized sigma24 family protein